VTTFGSAPAWAPDGRSLAFVSSEIVQVDFPGSSTSTIWLVPSEGGTPRRLTERWKPAGGHRSVSFAPDGRRLAFTSGGQVYMLELGEGTSDPQNVVSSEAGPGIRGIGSLGGWGEVRWSPDGQSLVGIGRQGHEVVLWRHDLARGVRTEPVTLLVGEPTQLLGHMALAPDGRRIAYSVLSARTDIMNLLLGADGRAASSPSPLFPGLVSRKALPQLSPDGRRIAFLLWRPGEGPVLYTAGSDGKDPTPAGTTGALGGASFGPGGRLIGAVKEADDDGHRLLEVDPASGAQRTLRHLPPAAWVRLSPDGQQVAFMCGGAPVFAICTAAVSGGDPKTLLAPKEGAGWPVWSPDGRQLAVELYDGEDTFVAVMPSEGGAPRRLTEARGQSWPHSWTPDGRSVVFAGQRHGLWNVYAVDVETGRERALTGYDRAVVYVRYPAWSPAGDRVVFEHTELSGNVWVAPLPGP
jgi:Tol biopolymer transport system component